MSRACDPHTRCRSAVQRRHTDTRDHVVNLENLLSNEADPGHSVTPLTQCDLRGHGQPRSPGLAGWGVSANGDGAAFRGDGTFWNQA